MASAGASPHLLTSNIIWPVHCSEVPADQQEHCAAKPGSQHSKGFPLFPLKLLFMNDATLEQKKMDCYVLVKILKYCTDSHARIYQLKFAVNDVFKNKNIKGMQKA